MQQKLSDERVVQFLVPTLPSKEKGVVVAKNRSVLQDLQGRKALEGYRRSSSGMTWLLMLQWVPIQSHGCKTASFICFLLLF